jgi:hypothetical protein
MSEDAPVNTGAGEWPDPDSAYLTVRRMQIKLHCWAGEDSSRRFGGLFNRPQWSSVHRLIQRRRDPLPLPRQHDSNSMDPESGSRRAQ